ncbi:hypothetical protein KUTeg_014391 [Tegillarca granosa]|uniref:Globin domain-containing protein n=1 Tax=Tegillarca granosa TaxID=220873 RepID=A0ABQ9EWI2_TEGGR|nr:hypothetical protein KUTeg_014391 [Tegillarca granosa]
MPNSHAKIMFEQNREVLKLFGDFANYTAEELVENRELEQHVTMVMNTIVEAISCLEDIDYVICMLHSIGKLHAKKMKNFDPQEFWKIEEPFLSAVKETLDDRYTANMDIIYKITIKFILEMLIEGFNYNTTV